MTKTTSEIAIVDENILANHASRDMPNIASINVSKSTKVHIGPKIVAVNQTIENKELIKDLPLPKYIWSVVKNTSKAERLSCLAAIAALFVCIFLIVYYTTSARTDNNSVQDVSPHEWNITREMWLARHYVSDDFEEEFKPAKLVIVQHTVTPECHTFIKCAAEVRTIQNDYLDNHKYDIPYNFLIGNDGRVYVGRGWNIVGAHTRYYNRCSVGIAFIGDYREEMPIYSKVTKTQMERFNMIVEEGVREGYIAADYYVAAALDVQNTRSPGSNVCKALQELEHYDHDRQFWNTTCQEIYSRV